MSYYPPPSRSQVPIGSQYTTGQKAPVSGVYAYVRHTDNTYCLPTPAEARIPLSKDETFPPHRRCGKGVVWQLALYA